MMTIHEREKLVAVLKGERTSGGAFVKALAEADHRTLVEAAKECILKPSGLLVNRTRFEILLDTLLTRVSLVPLIELAEQKKKGGK